MWRARGGGGRAGGCHKHDNIRRMWLGRGSYAKTAREAKVLVTDRQSQTDRPTDTATFRVACTRLEIPRRDTLML